LAKSNAQKIDRFAEGKLRELRKKKGTQKQVAGKAFSSSTLSRAERGFGVNFTSAILIGVELRILERGTLYDVSDRRIKRLMHYMRVVQRGRHAKGWNDYYAGVSELIREAA